MLPSKLNGLHPVVAEKARTLIAWAKAEGIDLVVTSGFRSYKEQAVLYAQGRTTPGKRVTNARPGQSWHNFACAVDVCPMVNGKPDWESVHWGQIGALGIQAGLLWGGSFKSFPDMPHFEWHPNLTLAEANRRHEGGLIVLAAVV